MTATVAPATARRSLPASLRALLTYRRALVALTLAALALRVLRLQQQLLWRDEVFTAVVTHRPLGGMLEALRQDSAPPLSYLLTHAIVALHDGPVALRLVSVLAGAAAVPLAAALARRAGGDAAAVCAAGFVCLAPSFVAWSRDARMYALATTLVMASALTLWRALERPSPLRLLLHAAVVAAAVNTQYLAVLAIAAQGLAAAVVLRPRPGALLRTGVATVAGGSALLPWLWYAHGQSQHLDSGFWASGPDPYHVAGMAAEFLNGPSVVHSVDSGTLVLTLEGVAVAGGVLALLGAVAWWRGAARASRRAAVYPLAAVLLGWLALVCVSLRYPLIESRYASVFWGPLAVITGAGLARLAPALRALATACLAAGCAAMVLLTVYPQPGALLAIMPRVGARDFVAADPGDYLLLLEYADPATLARTRVVATSLPWWWGVAAFPPDALAPAVPDGAAHVYVVWDTTESVPPLPPGYHRTALRCRSLVCVATYSR